MGIPTLIPTLLGYGVEGIAPPSQTEPWDILVGGLKFMLAAGPEHPYTRRGADYRNQQVNFSGEPGEVDLGFWWQRSQSTWHLGAGSPTFDGPGSGAPDIASGRYNTSFGVDPWAPGQVSLLADTGRVQAATAAGKELVAFTPGGVEKIAWLDGTFSYLWDGTTVSSADAGAPAWQSMTTDGTTLWLTDGDVVYHDITGPDTTPYIGLGGGVCLIRYAKQRIMLGKNNALYELDSAALDAALPGTPIFTHPNPDWVWTDIVGGPGAIYASGYAGTSSAVYKFVLTTGGALPTLSAGIVAVELPEGERVLCMKAYIGVFIALGTDHGLRVCSFSGTDIGLAPLTVTGRGSIRSITGWDRFLYVSCDDAGEGFAGLVRVDLSALTEFDRYAWAPDARANANAPAGFTGVVGTSVSVVMFQGRPVFMVAAAGVYAVSATRLAPAGNVMSGRIGFGMGDPKIFQRAAVTTTGQGQVVLSTGTDTDDAGVSRIIMDTSVRNRLEADIGSTRGSALTVGLDLARSTATQGPVVLSWTIRALPSQPREEQHLVPVRCYARTENAFGQTSYTDVMEQLDALAELVRYQTPVLFQTFVGDVGAWRTVVVQVEDFQFEQTTADDGWGGIVTLSLRSVVGGS